MVSKPVNRPKLNGTACVLLLAKSSNRLLKYFPDLNPIQDAVFVR